MAKMGTVNIDDFVKKDKSNITMVRVLLARSTLENGVRKSYYNLSDIMKARKFCNQLIHYGYEVCMNFCCGDIITEGEIKMIALAFNNMNIKAIYLADTYGGFNSDNVPKQLHKFYYEFGRYKQNIRFGFHSHNNNDDALNKTITAIYHGCSMVDSCIGGLGRGGGNLKTIQLLSYLDKENFIKRVLPIIKFYNKHIISKEEYSKNVYSQSHPYYKLSSFLSLHPNYIQEILCMNTDVEYDVELILKLDKYTKENNERNYDKDLIKKMV